MPMSSTSPCQRPDPLLHVLFARDVATPQRRNLHLQDLRAQTQRAVSDVVQRQAGDADTDESVSWTEEEIVKLHWGLLRELRRLVDADTPLEEKLDTLSWALTDPALDSQPFSFANCVRVVGTSPLSPAPYCGAVPVDDLRDWIRANAPRWLRSSLERYPNWVQDLVRQDPDHVAKQLSRNPQWINEQVKLHQSGSNQADLFQDQYSLLAF